MGDTILVVQDIRDFKGTSTELRVQAYLDKLELEELSHVVSFGDAKHNRDDVFTRVTQPPQVRHDLVSSLHVAIDTLRQHVLDQHGVRLVTNLKKNVRRLFKDKTC